MKKSIIIFIIIATIVITGIGIFAFWNYQNTNNKSSNYEVGRTSAESNQSNMNNSNELTLNQTSENNINEASQTDNNTISSNLTPPPQDTAPKEEEIASFSTKIVTKDANRQHNINLTCSTLNDTIVENGATFSFCNTVGQATSAKGYKEADIFDANGKKKKGLGGGNCQISSTLYNAVLAVSYLPVIERHPHSNYVPYIQKGKDAAVAYGSYDFKFRNDSGSKIKIQASATESEITTKLLKVY